MNGRPLRKFLFTFLISLAFSLAPLASPEASAQIQEQPTQVIEASPASNFSERAGLWPSSTIDQPNFENENFSEVFNKTPGLQSREAGSPTLSIRGSSGADRVLKLFEGIPLNLSDGLGGSNLFLPDEAIGSVRIFKGPASAFYGSSAISGAIDHRERVFLKPATRFSITDLGEQKVFAVAPFASGQATASYSRNSGKFPYQSTSSTLSGTRENNASDTTRATAIANYKFSSIEVRPVFLIVRSVGENPAALNTNFTSTFDYAATLASIEATKRFTDTEKFSLRLADTRQWGLFDRGASTESNSTVTRTLITGDYQADFSSAVVSRTFFDMRWDELRAAYLTGNLRQSGLDVGEGILYALSPELSLQPVLRYRTDSGDWIKALGLVRTDQLGKQWLTYSEGFREASLSDRFASESFYKGNPSLQPERTRSIESGFSYGQEDGLNFGSTLFLTRYENLFDTRSVGGGAIQKINSGSAQTLGGELSTGYGWHQEHLNFGYSYLDSKNDQTQESLRLAPRHQLSTSFEHRARIVITEVRNTMWSSYYDREVPSNNLRELPAWSTWDLNLRSNKVADWELKFGVLNIFNVPRELTIGFPEPQRRFYASALRSW